MGSCSGTQNIVQSLNLREALSQFQVPMPYADEYHLFQTLEQLEMQIHNTISGYFLLYSKIIDVQNKMIETTKQWQEKYTQHRHPNLLSIHYFSVLQETKVFIPMTEIILMIDYPIETLSRHKKVVSKISFNEEEIWFLLDCLVPAFAYQQTTGIYPSSFDIDDIVLVQTPQGEKVYKFVDRYFRPQKTSDFRKFLYMFDDKTQLADLKKNAWLSPLQIAAIPKKDKYLKHNRYKSDVFILGVLCVQLIYGRRPEFYDWKKWCIDEFAYRKTLDGLVGKGMSEKLLRVIEQMLQLDEVKRPDFKQLDSLISQAFIDLRMPRLLQRITEEKFYLQSIDKSQQQLAVTISQNKAKEIRSYNDQSVLSKQSNAIDNGNTNILKTTQLENTMNITQGTLRYSNGHYYVGQLCNRRRHGRGVFFDGEHNKLIEGQWSYDLPDGEVTMYNIPSPMNEASHHNLARLDWIQYKGMCKLGQRSGQGILFFSDGSKFNGNFVDGKAHGKGLYEYPTKQQIIGVWNYDEFIS